MRAWLLASILGATFISLSVFADASKRSTSKIGTVCSRAFKGVLPAGQIRQDLRDQVEAIKFKKLHEQFVAFENLIETAGENLKPIEFSYILESLRTRFFLAVLGLGFSWDYGKTVLDKIDQLAWNFYEDYKDKLDAKGVNSVAAAAGTFAVGDVVRLDFIELREKSLGFQDGLLMIKNITFGENRDKALLSYLKSRDFKAYELLMLKEYAGSEDLNDKILLSITQCAAADLVTESGAPFTTEQAIVYSEQFFDSTSRDRFLSFYSWIRREVLRADEVATVVARVTSPLVKRQILRNGSKSEGAPL